LRANGYLVAKDLNSAISASVSSRRGIAMGALGGLHLVPDLVDEA
jgi:hypothetical protein